MSRRRKSRSIGAPEGTWRESTESFEFFVGALGTRDPRLSRQLCKKDEGDDVYRKEQKEDEDENEKVKREPTWEHLRERVCDQWRIIVTRSNCFFHIYLSSREHHLLCNCYFVQNCRSVNWSYWKLVSRKMIFIVRSGSVQKVKRFPCYRWCRKNWFRRSSYLKRSKYRNYSSRDSFHRIRCY